MLKSYIGADGKRYTFNYEAGTAPAAPDGSTIDNANFTKVSWTIEDKTKPVEKEERINQDPIPIISKGYRPLRITVNTPSKSVKKNIPA